MQAQQKLFNKIVFTHFKRKIKVPQFAFDKVQSLLIAPSVALLFFFPLFSFQGAIESRYTLKIEQCKMVRKG